MSWTRRDVLARATALAASVVAFPTLGCAPSVDGDDGGSGDPDSATDTGDGLPTYAWDGPLGPEDTFAHGVASGDPLDDAVLLWTRVNADGDPVDVFLEIARDANFRRRLAAATYTARADADFTLTVDAIDLPASTTLYYRFSALGRTSPIGRTRTTGPAERVRLGVCSCSNYAFGYFHAYKHLAARPDLDAVLHLGDYVYEYASAGHGRTYGTFRELDPPHEILTLDDYRRRYAHYQSDPDLAELHRQHPVIHIWDDHEFADDPRIGGADNHQDDEGDWNARRDAALQAYTEWMPTRLRDGNRIYRALGWGDDVRLLMLDRQRRYLWPEPEDDHYLGAEQAAWLQAQVAATTARWLVLGQGTSFTSRRADGVGGSSWDATSRRGLLDAVDAASIDNLVVLTGDIHRFDALDVVHDPVGYDPDTGAGSEGVEIAVGSISSPGSTGAHADVPHYRWSQGIFRGYVVLDLTADRAQADVFGFADLFKTLDVAPGETFLSGWRTQHGSRHLAPAEAPIADRSDAPALAP